MEFETLPRIKTFLWQCMHYSIGVGECLVRRCLSEFDVCPMFNREFEMILHRLEIAPFRGIPGLNRALTLQAIFMRVTSCIGWRRIVKMALTRCGINLLGRLSFPLPSGAFGRTETILCFGTGLLNQTYTTTLSLEPRNFSIASVKQSAWIARPW